ncbi:palindromic element RPE4 domain-containing protein [Rickettsia sp.]|uniref:palindromic element RPE4 domain-containing protein n=1 Tax=Rickettsia sp. TaxID=789 RepID=UPI00397A7A52
MLKPKQQKLKYAWCCCVDWLFSVIPRLDRGIQLKILTLLVFFNFFMDTVVKPRYDTERVFRSTQPMAARNDDFKYSCKQTY